MITTRTAETKVAIQSFTLNTVGRSHMTNISRNKVTILDVVKSMASFHILGFLLLSSEV